MQNSHLILNAIGKNQLGITNAITKLCLKAKASIMDSRIANMGDECVISMLLAGSWGAIAKVETAIPNLEKKLGLHFTTRRTRLTTPEEKYLQYTVQITTIDRLGIMHELTSFFYAQGISIEDINSETYIASRTNTTMFRLSMTINIPESAHIITLREQFITYCEEKNLDAILLEPQKY